MANKHMRTDTDLHRRHKLRRYRYLGILFQLLLVGGASSVTVTPCYVHNTLLQPTIGVSATTRQMVDIIQAPPLLTQTVQAGICLESNSTNILPNSKMYSPYICQQRYTAVELYTNWKMSPEKLQSARSLRSILKLPEDWLRRGLRKDFVLIESGCDLLIDYSATEVPTGSRYYPHGNNLNYPLGSSSNNPSYIEVRQPETPNHPEPNKPSTQKKRGSPLKVDFLRQQLPLHFRTQSLPERKESMSTDASETNVAEVNHPNPSPGPPELEPENLSTTPNSNTEYNENTGDESRNGQEKYFGNGIQITEIKPEEIGLPLLILEPELDPVLKLLENVNVTFNASQFSFMI